MINLSTDTFEVYVFKRIPYLTTILAAISILIFVFVYLGLAPLMSSKNHSDEIGILYFMTFYPDKLKVALFMGIPTLILFWFLYVRVRIKRDAVLTFDTDKIELRGKGWSRSFPVNKVRYIDCYDPYNGEGYPKEKFTLALRTWSGKGTLINLKNYSQATRLIDILNVYEEIKLEVFTDNRGQSKTNDEL
ncbi:MAG: hypothetical protein H0W84_08530 [Bacteroidetes bacterium]|nr:hypothetical protein [Bacteroidota bacterium]